MDGWVPKGNSGTPSLSGDGAFERFLTAAIAAIITIMFSWRLLDDMNDQDFHRGPFVEATECPPEVKSEVELTREETTVKNLKDVSSKNESSKERVGTRNEIVSFESRQGMTSIIDVDNDTDWERYSIECDQYLEHVESCGKNRSSETGNRYDLKTCSAAVTDKYSMNSNNIAEPMSQLQETDSDDDSYVCTLLEPILEEDSDDIFSGSDEHESQRSFVEEEMSYEPAPFKHKPKAMFVNSNTESSEPEVTGDSKFNVSSHDVPYDTVDDTSCHVTLNTPPKGPAKAEGDRPTRMTTLKNSEFYHIWSSDYFQNHADIPDTLLATYPVIKSSEILAGGNNIENGTHHTLDTDSPLQVLTSEEEICNMNQTTLPQHIDAPFDSKSLISSRIPLSMMHSHKSEEASEHSHDDKITVTEQNFVLKKAWAESEHSEKFRDNDTVNKQEKRSLSPGANQFSIARSDLILPHEGLWQEETVTGTENCGVVQISNLSREVCDGKSDVSLCPARKTKSINIEHNNDVMSEHISDFQVKYSYTASNRAHVYKDAGISTGLEETPSGFTFLYCESEQSRNERRAFLVDKPLFPDFETFINAIPLTSEGLEEVHEWSVENDGYSAFVRELSQPGSIKDSACSSGLQGPCPLLSGNLTTPLGSSLFHFPEHLVSSERDPAAAGSEEFQMKDRCASDTSSESSLATAEYSSLQSNSHLREKSDKVLDSSFIGDGLVVTDRMEKCAYLQEGNIVHYQPVKCEALTADNTSVCHVLLTGDESKHVESDLSLQISEQYMLENRAVLQEGPEVQCVLDSESSSIQTAESEMKIHMDSEKASAVQTSCGNKISSDESTDRMPDEKEDEDRNSLYDSDEQTQDENILDGRKESSEDEYVEDLHGCVLKHRDGEKRPRSLKEIRRKYANQKSFLSVMQQNLPLRSFVGHFTIPDNLLTPTKVKIMASRKKFLSAEHLNDSCSMDTVQKQFDLHKLPRQEYRERLYKSPNRSYKASLNRIGQDQFEKLQNLMNYSRQSETSLEQLPIHHLHENCIFSPQGRRDLLNKTMSIENIQLPVPDELFKCISLPTLICTGVSACDTSDCTSFSHTNHDVNACLFQQQPLERSASMSNLQSDSFLTGNEGIPTSSKKVGKGRFAHHQYKKSKSLCTLETNIDEVDAENTTNLTRLPSVHELRVSKSLQKLNVPDWFKQSSLSKSSSCLLKYGSSSTVNSFSFSPSLISSPCASTAPPATNIVIKTRVLPPSCAHPLRSPRSLTSSAGIDKKLPAQSVKLPSEKLREKEKSKSLMPIPIVPFAEIRAMFESKSRNAQHETIKQAVAEVSIVNVTDVSGDKTISQSSSKMFHPVSEDAFQRDDSPSNPSLLEEGWPEIQSIDLSEHEGHRLKKVIEMPRAETVCELTLPVTAEENFLNGKHIPHSSDNLTDDKTNEAKLQRTPEKDSKVNSSMKSFKHLLGLSKQKSFDYHQQHQLQDDFQLYNNAVYETEPRRLGVTQLSLSSKTKQDAHCPRKTANGDSKLEAPSAEVKNIIQPGATAHKSATTQASLTMGRTLQGFKFSGSQKRVQILPGSSHTPGIQPESLCQETAFHPGSGGAAAAIPDLKSTATRSLKETTV